MKYLKIWTFYSGILSLKSRQDFFVFWTFWVPDPRLRCVSHYHYQSHTWNTQWTKLAEKQIDDIDEIKIIDEIDEIDRIDEIDQLDEINEIDKIDKIIKIDEIIKINEINEIDKID